MRILYVITRSNWGGAQAHLLELIKNQVSRNNSITLVVGEEGELTERVRAMSRIKVIVIPQLVRKLSPAKDLVAIFKLRLIIKQVQPDIVHLHSSKAGAVGRIANIGLNGKTVFTAHGWSFTEGVNPSKRKVYLFLEKVLIRLADEVICVSKYDLNLGDKMLTPPSGMLRLVYNGVQINDTSTTPERKNKRQLNVVMVARFDTQKNQAALINALGSSNRTDIRVTFIGDGEKENECRQLAARYGLTNQVRFLGYRSDIDSQLDQADIFVLTTNYEGLPISILEAMERSLPIIATDVGGINEEVVDGINGRLVQNTNDSIIGAINDVEHNLTLYGAASRRIVSQKFTIQSCVNSVNEIYDSLVGDKK